MNYWSLAKRQAQASLSAAVECLRSVAREGARGHDEYGTTQHCERVPVADRLVSLGRNLHDGLDGSTLPTHSARERHMGVYLHARHVDPIDCLNISSISKALRHGKNHFAAQHTLWLF